MIVEELMLPMRDGVRLQTFLTLPEGDGPFPALLVRCMYGHDKVQGTVDQLVAAGYATAAQNVRGRYQSQGELPRHSNTPEDGYDTIDWLAKQPWCSGRVGTFGRSALARVQTDTAFLAHPAHRAMAPQVLPFGMNSRLGGAFMYSQIPQWLYFTHSGAELKPYNVVDWMPHLYTLPAADCLKKLGGPVAYTREFMSKTHEQYQNMDDREGFERLNTANLMVTGWYDHCATGPIDFYLQTQKYGSAAQRQNTHLLIGPWDHSCAGQPWDEYSFSDRAVVDHVAAEIAFFDRHLKEAVKVEPPAPVRLFTMGRNRWRDEPAWPLERATDRCYYLHSEGNVRGAWERGTLSTQPPGDEPVDKFLYDPADPVPTWGGATSAPASALPMLRGARDQRFTLYRKDVLTYFSEPMDEPLEVTGMLRMVLYASSTAKDTDFTVKLMDVELDGNARLISDGIVRARFRAGIDKPELLTPGEVVKYEVDLWFTSNEFQTGHRIGVAISSSNFPRFNRNLNTGGDNERDAEFITAEQTIFHDAGRPSHLVLPVVESIS